MNNKYCILTVNKFGKYSMTVRTMINSKLKTIRTEDHMTHLKAKRMLEHFGVESVEAEIAVQQLEEFGYDICVFNTQGRIGYLDFIGIVH